MKITNISKGPRGIHTVDGPRIINPGDTIEAELSEAELEGSKETGWFSIEDGETKATGAHRDDLKKQAAELGIDYPRNIPTEKLKELIDAKLAE